MNRYCLAVLLMLLSSALSPPALAAANDGPRSGSETNPHSRQTPGSEASKAERDDIVIHTQRAMEELRAAVEELRKRADKASGEAKGAFERQLRLLQEEQKQLEKKFLELEAVTARQWKELLEEIDRAVEGLDRPAPKPRSDAI